MAFIHERVLTDDLPWEPWDRYFPGAPPVEGEHGGWVKVLKRPSERDPGSTFLLKWVGYPGKKVRLTAVVPEGGDEEVYRLEGNSSDEAGPPTVPYYLYHGPGTPHGGVYADDFVSILRYSGGPDIITSYEFIDR
jgi:hypothetical protein